MFLCFHCYFTYFLRINFWNSSMFTVKLRGRYRDFHILPCPYTWIAPNISHQSGTLANVTATDEPTLKHHYHPKSSIIVANRVFLLSKISLDWPVYPCLPIHGAQDSKVSSRISYGWNHAICNLLGLVSLI